MNSSLLIPINSIFFTRRVSAHAISLAANKSITIYHPWHGMWTNIKLIRRKIGHSAGELAKGVKTDDTK